MPRKSAPSSRSNGSRPAKPELSGDERLRRLWRSLHDQIHGAFFSNALKTCEKSETGPPAVLRQWRLIRQVYIVLALAPSSPLALRTKTQLLISLERYKEALAAAALSSDASLLKVYCLYKMGAYQEADETLQQCAEADDRGRQLLEAQIVRYGVPPHPFFLREPLNWA
jgi:tetratricopeptide (TPR) repeat protein